MSLLPIMLRDGMMDSMRPSRIQNQHFGDCLTPQELVSPFTVPSQMHMGYYRPWRSHAAARDTGSTIALDKETFQVTLDVQQFKPEEITVKVTGNRQITIEGKHEEKQDEHGFISRHFVRRYMVPENYDIERTVSNLSSDGVLSIAAPCINNKESEHKQIPITQTGKPAIEKRSET